MNCLLVPTLALDLSLLDRLADSIDYPIKDKVIINNGRRGALSEWKQRHPGWRVVSAGRNLGVAGSWNMAPILWPDDDAWLLVNDDVVFDAGCVELISDTAREQAKNVPVLFLNNTHWFYCFVWTRKGLNQFGTFDENLWPAYYEDCDMRLRYNLAGVKHAYIANPACPLKHGKPKPGGMNYNAVINGCGLFNREYFLRKWGSLDETKPAFKTPFNNPQMGTGDWMLEEHHRNLRMALWNTFLSMPTPSIYT